ncbi:squalene/phytoene synthase family protein [Streptosporangium sp. NPDC049248]|uniref:squalene/phytoene synthase family protein n=1 Tax=Streptosporangium sp. NPDC049248 TaxID=3155651 RepID=UPI0034223C7A
MDTVDAYRHCEQIVRGKARNFSYGLRLLPTPKRRALSAVYAFARRIDDIADGNGPDGQRLTDLAAARAALGTARPDPEDPVLVALHDTVLRYPLPLSAFEELIDGCAADVLGETYEHFDELLSYCRCVAGSIGRLSLGVFGTAGTAGTEDGGGGGGGGDAAGVAHLADALGVALQITNILRDVREDRLAGRTYLPAEDLRRFGCTLNIDSSGRFTDPPDRLAALMRFEADRARDWFDDGMRLLTALDVRSAACTAAMAGIYRCLLGRIAADPAAALASRLSLPPWQKAMVAARALAGAAR